MNIKIYAKGQDEHQLFSDFEDQVILELTKMGYMVYLAESNRNFKFPSITIEAHNHRTFEYFKQRFDIQKAQNGADGWGRKAMRALQLDLRL